MSRRKVWVVKVHVGPFLINQKSIIRVARPITTLLASSTRGMSTTSTGSGLSRYASLPKFTYDEMASSSFLKERQKRVSEGIDSVLIGYYCDRVLLWVLLIAL